MRRPVMSTTVHSDHIGSLLRPGELIEARRQHIAGKISDAQLEEVEDASIVKALDLQSRQVWRFSRTVSTVGRHFWTP
jgi:5-methyltetrahydropteroyltriglutamate--homocysteine methyltransferase